MPSTAMEAAGAVAGVAYISKQMQALSQAVQQLSLSIQQMKTTPVVISQAAAPPVQPVISAPAQEAGATGQVYAPPPAYQVENVFSQNPQQTGAGLTVDDLIRVARMLGLQENAYRILRIDLTQDRSNGQKFDISGTSLTVLNLGGADWSLQLIQGDGSLGDILYSTDLVQGSELHMAFAGIQFTNVAAAQGTASCVLYIGRRV